MRGNRSEHVNTPLKRIYVNMMNLGNNIKLDILKLVCSI